MQKTKLCFEIENHLGIDSSYKIPPPLVTRKFRQHRRKTIISRDICKKRNYASKSKTIWELILLIKYLLLWWPENLIKIAVKPLFHEMYAKNEIMLRNRKPFGNWFFPENTCPFVKGKNFVKIAVKPLFHEIYAENLIMARNQ